MCDCDKTRRSTDTTHPTYSSVIIRKLCVTLTVGSITN